MMGDMQLVKSTQRKSSDFGGRGLKIKKILGLIVLKYSKEIIYVLKAILLVQTIIKKIKDFSQ